MQSHLILGNRQPFSDGRKRMQRPGDMEDLKKKISAREKVLQHETLSWAGGSGRQEVGGSRKKAIGSETAQRDFSRHEARRTSDQ